MKRTYIATTSEAKALHDGSQTAIICKMRVQPKCDTHRLHTVLDTTGDKENIGSHFWAKMDNGYPERESDYFKPPYAIGHEVVVREKWTHTKIAINLNEEDENSGYIYAASDNGQDWEKSDEHWTWRSPATMPVSAARTRIIPVSCEAVRVRDMIFSKRHSLNVTRQGEHEAYIIHKLGQPAWDENHYIFYYKIDKV